MIKIHKFVYQGVLLLVCSSLYLKVDGNEKEEEGAKRSQYVSDPGD